ncbi:polysaccharide deacetylase family protein [Planococcus ruber]|uniref:polysaccharide deacetylase family protein n=1 Tax=Planococcus ruber TaxID=2027871 RepID=UPI001FEF36B9|nr:polysaccharide deacetylase family protein [Planococcus ruber]MCJ1907112.1 polysaccharide deacetylase family protein [Planococcus ruber]
MVHMKWLILTVGISLLAACSDEQTETVNEKETAPVEEQAEETPAETENANEEESGQAEEAEQEEIEKEEVESEAEPEPQYRLNPATWGVEPIADAPAEAVLLTIDDAPDKHAVDMAVTLKELNVPAIFFVNGHFLDSEAEKENLKKIHEMGFLIGNHTQTHPNLTTISEDQQKQEILTVNETVEQVIGEKPKFFRAPHGANTDFSRALVQQEGMMLMNWSYGYDWEKQYMDPAALTDIMVNTEFLHNGSNLLMHDREWTAAALPGIVDGLKAKGYTFVDPHEIELQP